MKLYGAILQKDGTYAIVGRWLMGTRHSNTYNIRNKLSALGGKFDSVNKRWIGIKEENLNEIGATKQVKVLVEKYCHEPEDYHLVYEDDIVDGMVRVSCPRCDSFNMRAKVLKNLGAQCQG